MMKSVKPTIYKNKVIADVYKSFLSQTRRMIMKNEEFWKVLGTKEVDCVVDNVDAHNMRIKDDSATLIVTATAIWLGSTDKLSEFRSKFIGFR